MAQLDVIQKLKDHIGAFNSRDWNRYKALLQNDATYDEEATQQKVQGADKIIDIVKRWTVAFPDLQGKIKETFASGDRVVCEIEWEGTHNGMLTGPMGSLAPTGKHGRVLAVQVATFANGRIGEIRHYFDLMTVLLQLGVRPQLGAQPTP